MPRVHDRGGWPIDEPINRGEHQLMDWERRIDALNVVLGEKGLRGTDEHRRAMESLPPQQYEGLSYYQRWAAGLELLLLEKGILTRSELDAKLAELERQEG
jgi:hypothetical protein